MSGVVITRGMLRAGRLDAVGLASLALVVIFGASPMPSSSLSFSLTLSSCRLGCTMVSVMSFLLQQVSSLLLRRFSPLGEQLGILVINDTTSS